MSKNSSTQETFSTKSETPTSGYRPKLKNSSTYSSKIPNLNGSYLNTETYDYDKLMSLVSPARVKTSIDFDKKRLNSLATPKKSSENVADRLLSYQQLADNRIRFKKIEQEHKEMENCTFSPKINNKDPPRSLNQFLDMQKGFETDKRTKIEKIKGLKKKEEHSKSESSLVGKVKGLKKGKKNVYDRLYEDSKTIKSLI